MVTSALNKLVSNAFPPGTLCRTWANAGEASSDPGTVPASVVTMVAQPVPDVDAGKVPESDVEGQPSAP